MDIFGLLTMVGGLALFLYGMIVLGDGLAKTSGGRLEKTLEKLTSNPFKAVLLGAAVTGVIQSSSATTVMVVGFVNSGIMKLTQAIGVIMGANIGTTVTAWLLSLTGIEGSNLFLKLCKPSSFTPVLAVIGILLLMSKKESRKNIGTIFLGFAVLMFGMETMGAAVKPLAQVPEFQQLLLMFSNPIFGILVGTLFTAAIQSSSASVGVLQMLCNSGAVSFGSAIPIIMGQNIGTCITAMLSSIGASKNAKRAAFVHLYFNVIGTLLFLVGFYSVNFFVHFSFLKDTASAADIAIVHTCFNVATTLILFPFAKWLEKLAIFTVRDEVKPEVELTVAQKLEEELQILDVRFLDVPSVAVKQCKTVTVKMAEIARDTLFGAMDLVDKFDLEKAKQLYELEAVVDKYEDVLGNYLIQLSSRKLSEKESKEVSLLLHSIGDFERISDHAVNIVHAAEEVDCKEACFSKKAMEELAILTAAIKEIVGMTMKVFEEEDVVLAKAVEPLEEVIDYLKVELKNRHIKRLRKGKCTIEMGFVLSDITTNYERISDHCSNIAVCILQEKGESIQAHEYLDSIKRTDNQEFHMQVQELQKKYLLP